MESLWLHMFFQVQETASVNEMSEKNYEGGRKLERPQVAFASGGERKHQSSAKVLTI